MLEDSLPLIIMTLLFASGGALVQRFTKTKWSIPMLAGISVLSAIVSIFVISALAVIF